MGRKPAERDGENAALMRSGPGFEPNVPCGCCGAGSRRVRRQWRVCANGHTFVKKSDSEPTKCAHDPAPLYLDPPGTSVRPEAEDAKS